MINLIANRKLKNLGCQWDGYKWVAPKLAIEEAQQINEKFYSDMIAVKIVLKPNENLKGLDWGASHVLLVAGYVIASVTGRDSGAKVTKGVAILSGSFKSGGSMKNYYCAHDDIILKMEVSRNALYLLDKEVDEGIYTYEIIHSIETNSFNPLEKFSTDELMLELEKRQTTNGME